MDQVVFPINHRFNKKKKLTFQALQFYKQYDYPRKYLFKTQSPFAFGSSICSKHPHRRTHTDTLDISQPPLSPKTPHQRFAPPERQAHTIRKRKRAPQAQLPGLLFVLLGLLPRATKIGYRARPRRGGPNNAHQKYTAPALRIEGAPS